MSWHSVAAADVDLYHSDTSGKRLQRSLDSAPPGCHLQLAAQECGEVLLDAAVTEAGDLRHELRRHEVVVLHAHLDCYQNSEVVAREVAHSADIELHVRRRC